MTFVISLVAGFLGVPRPLAGILAWAAIAALAAGVALGGYQIIKHRGAEELRARIEKDNSDAVRNGLEARLSFDDCAAAGGVWDFRRQRCARAARGPR